MIDGIEEDSRFDYIGVDENDRNFVLEVKNVPLADFEDISEKDKKKLKVEYGIERSFGSKVAYFPDGYRKKSEESVSPRALKHLRTLTHIKRNDSLNKKRCIICFVIQRRDADRFTPSIIDPEYRRAFYDARAAGVEVIVMQVEWKIEPDTDGSLSAAAYFVTDNLPVVEEDSVFTPQLSIDSVSKRELAVSIIEAKENITSEFVEEIVKKKARTTKKR